MIKAFFKKNLLTSVGLAIGAVGGFLYRKYVGCTGSTCPTISSSVDSALRGVVMGGLLLNLFKTGSIPRGID